MSGWQNTWAPPHGPFVREPASAPRGSPRPRSGAPSSVIEHDPATIADSWDPPHPALSPAMSPAEAPAGPVVSTRRAAGPIAGPARRWEPPHPSLMPISDPSQPGRATPALTTPAIARTIAAPPEGTPITTPPQPDRATPALTTPAIAPTIAAPPEGSPITTPPQPDRATPALTTPPPASVAPITRTTAAPPDGAPARSVGDPTGDAVAGSDLWSTGGAPPPSVAPATAWPAPRREARQVEVERHAPAARAAPPPRRRGFRIPRWGWLAGAAIGLITLVFVSTRGEDPSPVAAPDPPTAPTPAVAPATTAAPRPASTTTIVAQLGPAPPVPPVPPAPSEAPPTGRAVEVTGEISGTGNAEWVRFTNVGTTPLVMDGWTVRDDGFQHLYRFGTFVLGAGAHVTLFSGCGEDSPSELYWCNDGTDIWNDGGDVVIVVDENESVIARRQL